MNDVELKQRVEIEKFHKLAKSLYVTLVAEVVFFGSFGISGE